MLLHPQFDPVAFTLGPLSVRWYGLMYLVAFVQFILLGRYRIKTRPGLLTVEQLDDLAADPLGYAAGRCAVGVRHPPL